MPSPIMLPSIAVNNSTERCIHLPNPLPVLPAHNQAAAAQSPLRERMSILMRCLQPTSKRLEITKFSDHDHATADVSPPLTYGMRLMLRSTLAGVRLGRAGVSLGYLMYVL